MTDKEILLAVITGVTANPEYAQFSDETIANKAINISNLLTEKINEKFQKEENIYDVYGIDLVAIDTGYNTQYVKRWVAKNKGKVIPVHGKAYQSLILSVPSLSDTRKDRKDKTGSYPDERGSGGIALP